MLHRKWRFFDMLTKNNHIDTTLDTLCLFSMYFNQNMSFVVIKVRLCILTELAKAQYKKYLYNMC